jgi:hypothetical protein
LLRERSYPIDVTAAPPKVYPHAVLGPTQDRKRLGKREVAMLPVKIIIFIVRHEHADAPHPLGLLRSRYHRPPRTRRRIDRFIGQLIPAEDAGERATSPAGLVIEPRTVRCGDMSPFVTFKAAGYVQATELPMVCPAAMSGHRPPVRPKSTH